MRFTIDSLADLSDESCSEIPWVDTDDTERYYFDNPAVCMIFNTGELTLVEYGRDEILGTFRYGLGESL
jgi:intraflagellar transport protein 172